jgi:hypothetical protein
MPTQIVHHVFEAVREFVSRCTVPIIEESGERVAVFGTGVLIRDSSEHYLVTAQHVGDDIWNRGLGIPIRYGTSELWVPGNGKKVSSVVADLFVYRFDDAKLIEQLSAGWTFLDIQHTWTGEPSPDWHYFLLGFPREQATLSGEVICAPPVSFVTTLLSDIHVELPESYNPTIDVMLAHRTTGIRQETHLTDIVPRMPGMSGCGVWAVIGSLSSGGEMWSVHNSVRLVAIQTSYSEGRWIRTRRWAVANEAVRKVREGTAAP